MRREHRHEGRRYRVTNLIEIAVSLQDKRVARSSMWLVPNQYCCGLIGYQRLLELPTSDLINVAATGTAADTAGEILSGASGVEPGEKREARGSDDRRTVSTACGRSSR